MYLLVASIVAASRTMMIKRCVGGGGPMTPSYHSGAGGVAPTTSPQHFFAPQSLNNSSCSVNKNNHSTSSLLQQSNSGGALGTGGGGSCRLVSKLKTIFVNVTITVKLGLQKKLRGRWERVSFNHSFFYQLCYQRRRFESHKSGGVKTFLISKCFLSVFYPSSTVLLFTVYYIYYYQG